ncbi:MAG: hypothetical protein OHK0023_06590 [Anaerolineae bacterium]
MRRLMIYVLVTAVLVGSFGPNMVSFASDGCLVALDVPNCKYGLPAAEYDALLAAMQANPAPAVQQIGVDPEEVRRWSFWKIDGKGVTLYDSPGGIALGQTDPGFSFVTPKSRVEGWFEIEPGQWVSQSNLSGTRASSFTGVMLGGLPFPMAWILQPTRPSSVPGHRALKSTPLLPQYTRVYIYHTLRIGDWDWYLVGDGKWVEQRRVGMIKLHPNPPTGGRWVGVDLYEQVMVAYEGGTPIFATLVSSGLRQWPTNEGLFKVWAKMNIDGMSGSMGKPDQYDIPIVPYVMYFDGSKALHGAFWHNGFGYRRSHGCVNLSVGDAKWLFDFVSVDTPVLVWSSR